MSLDHDDHSSRTYRCFYWNSSLMLWVTSLTCEFVNLVVGSFTFDRALELRRLKLVKTMKEILEKEILHRLSVD